MSLLGKIGRDLGFTKTKRRATTKKKSSKKRTPKRNKNGRFKKR